MIIVTSAYALVEVQRLDDLEKKEGMSREDQSKQILLFFQNQFISLRPLDRQIGELAHEFTRTHSLAGGDALHVATAIVNKVDVFYTWDEHKKRTRRGLLIHNGKIGAPPLRIEKPPSAVAGTLFDEKNIPEENKPESAKKPD